MYVPVIACNECAELLGPAADYDVPPSDDVDLTEIINTGEPERSEFADGWLHVLRPDPEDPICIETLHFCPECKPEQA